MSRSRVLPLALAACAAVLTVSGCAAGFDPYTSPSVKPRDAANYPDVGNTSPVAVRHAYILGPTPDEQPYATGSSAAVYLSLINQTTEPDTLMSVDSPVATEVPIAGAPDETQGRKVDDEKKPGGGSSATTIELPAPADGGSEGDPVLVGQPPYSQNTVTLTDLKQELRNGSIVSVTLRFQKAGEITMQLPVVPRSAYRSTLSPAPTGGASESPSETPTDTDSASPTGEAE